MRDETPKLRHAHDIYCQDANASIVLTMDRLYYWTAWFARGFTEDDLRLVLRYLQHEIKEGRRYLGALKWSNLIQQPDRFEEDLQLARGWERNHRPAVTPKERVLTQARPVACGCDKAQDNVRSIGEVVAAMREAAK